MRQAEAVSEKERGITLYIFYNVYVYILLYIYI